MIKIRTMIAVLLSVIFSFSLIAPAMAVRFYNPDTNSWEDPTQAAVKAASKGKRGSAIQKETVDYDGNSGPITFDENGAITSISWTLLGGNIPQGTTASGNTFALQPGDQPTKVVAQFNAGAGVARLQVEAPVEPADGSIPGCKLVATP